MKFAGEADTERTFTYVGQFYATAVNGYRTTNKVNGSPVCTIGISSVQGMASDRLNTLYVATRFTGDRIGVATYGAHCGKVGPTFDDPTGISVDPVVDGNTLYVTNLINTFEQPATIEIYANGATSPTGELSDPSVVKGIGVAVDSRHNLFWSSTTQFWSGGQVVEFPRGTMPGVILNPTKIGSDSPGGVIVDGTGNLLLVDQNAKAIYAYAPPYISPAFSTITLKGTSVYCAMGHYEQRLYCLDYEYGSVDVYAYPAGNYVYSYTKGIDSRLAPIGIAIEPVWPP
jgi:hypothetical protein